MARLRYMAGETAKILVYSKRKRANLDAMEKDMTRLEQMAKSFESQLSRPPLVGRKQQNAGPTPENVYLILCSKKKKKT